MLGDVRSLALGGPMPASSGRGVIPPTVSGNASESTKELTTPEFARLKRRCWTRFRQSSRCRSNHCSFQSSDSRASDAIDATVFSELRCAASWYASSAFRNCSDSAASRTLPRWVPQIASVK